jgi:hypothetical protein
MAADFFLTPNKTKRTRTNEVTVTPAIHYSQTFYCSLKPNFFSMKDGHAVHMSAKSPTRPAAAPSAATLVSTSSTAVHSFTPPPGPLNGAINEMMASPGKFPRVSSHFSKFL